MISKQLEHLLVEFAGCTPGEMTQRFQKARECDLLPRSRGEHAEALTNEQIAAALLCVVPERPAYAGLQGKALANLRPVGGMEASFCGAATLTGAIAATIDRPDEIYELEVLDGEFGVNCYGYAAIHHRRGTAHYVHRNALSLMHRGAEREFDPRDHVRDHPIQRRVAFSSTVFERIARKVRDARAHRKLVETRGQQDGVSAKTPRAEQGATRRRANLLVSIAVHSSVGLQRQEYYFLYKGYEFKFVPNWRKSESDALTGRFPNSLSEGECYKLMTEFVSAFAFERDAKVMPSPGMIAHNDFRLNEYMGCYVEKRRVPVEEVLEEFVYIPPIRDETQSTLVRLYRQARAASDVHSGLLFFWHAIVYPSSDDQDGVDWIDLVWKNSPGHLSHLNAEVDRLLKNPIFRPKAAPSQSLGAYMRDGIRHSVAHIVRNRANSRSIDIDQIDELRHLNDAQTVLRYYSRYRLEHECGLRDPHDTNVFCYFNPQE